MTIADLRVQRNIEFNLKQLYPSLEVQGEEDPSMYSIYEPTIKPSEVVRDLIKQEKLNEYHRKRAEYLEIMRPTYPEIVPKGSLFETFESKDAVVWIDPLDGTNDFVTGNLPAVTVLIGLSIKGVSRIGIVHNPFNEDNNALGRTLFGTIEHGLFKIEYNEANCSGELYNKR